MEKKGGNLLTSRKEELRKVTYSTFSLAQEFRKVQELRKDYDRTSFDILILIASQKRMRPSDIAAALQLNPSSITRRMQLLLQEGLVSAENDPSDQRSSLITLTLTGEKALESYFVRSVDANDRLLENLHAVGNIKFSSIAGILCITIEGSN